MAHDLYTSQIHIKRLLAGQATARFTMAPESVLQVLDPAFFPGMGAVNEDDEGRLQCPVRGCGKWFTKLARHLSADHRALGGAQGVRAALGIRKSVPLTSKAARAVTSAQWNAAPNRSRAFVSTIRAFRMSENGSNGPKTMHDHNFSDTCPAQIQERIEALARKVGHSPSCNEFVAEYGGALFAALRQRFGTWNNAKVQCGLTTTSSVGYTRAAVMLALQTFYDARGDLPRHRDTAGVRGARGPYVPSRMAIIKALSVGSWEAAMRSAAEYLGVNSELYGFYFRRNEIGAA
jgi:hypothetical protein